MTTRRSDPFFQVPSSRHPTSLDEVELPILYVDVAVVEAFFLCDRDAVADRLEGTGLEPALVRGDRAVVAMAFFEYRETSIGPYEEVGLAVPTLRSDTPRPASAWLDLLLRPARQRKVGFRVLDLPVTTDAACTAGRELWGYPKFVTRISFAWTGPTIRCSVEDPDSDGTILTFTGELGPGIPVPPFSLLNFDHVGGRDLRTVVDVRGRGTLAGAGSLRLDVGSSSHRMATHLRDLGLHRAHPFAVMHTRRFQSRLNAGEPVRSVERRPPAEARAERPVPSEAAVSG